MTRVEVERFDDGFLSLGGVRMDSCVLRNGDPGALAFLVTADSFVINSTVSDSGGAGFRLNAGLTVVDSLFQDIDVCK